MGLRERLANPIFAQAVAAAAQQGVYLLGQYILLKKIQPMPRESEQMEKAIGRIDRLIEKLDNELKAIREAASVAGADGHAVVVVTAKDENKKPRPEKAEAVTKIEVEDAVERAAAEETKVEEVPIRVVVNGGDNPGGEESNPGSEADEPQPYSRYAPEMDVSAACLPCTRAHLAMVAGSLEEALRFARADGIDHPEVIKRLTASGKDLVVLERYDLAPEKIQQASPEEQKVIRELLPGIRKLRQDVLNRVKTPEDLERIAAEAEKLYQKAVAAGFHRPIDWSKVEKQLFPEAAGKETTGSQESTNAPKQENNEKSQEAA